MPTIPVEFRRILEDQVDQILGRHLSSASPVCSWLISKAFDVGEIVSKPTVRVHKHKDYRRVSGDNLAFGETDVEVIVDLRFPDGSLQRSALLIENKVDANEMENQGLRYRARARHEASIGTWNRSVCILFAPRNYLEVRYPLGEFSDSGWDLTCTYEDFAARVPDLEDKRILLEATATANSWNKPIPSAVKFWKDYALFGRAHHPDVPVFVETRQGSRVGGVWPSFYDNQLRNSRNPRRKRVQIVHMDTTTYVSLFLKRVRFSDFADTVGSFCEDGMMLARPGASWQSLQIKVPAVDPQQPLELQTAALDEVFEAARRLYDYYLKNETALLQIPVISTAPER